MLVPNSNAALEASRPVLNLRHGTPASSRTHTTVTGPEGGRCGCHATAATAAGGAGAEPVPLEGGLGERPGLAEAVVGRLVEPGVERARPPVSVSDGQAHGRGPARVLDGAPARASRDDLQAEGLGRTARRARRPASRRGSRAGPAPPIAAMR